FTGIDDAWRWETGNDVSADQIYSYLDNPEESGLVFLEPSLPKEAQAGCSAIISALSYVSWHAYRAAKKTIMPSPIHEVNEGIVNEVVEFARQCPSCSMSTVDCIANLLTETSKGDPSALGNPIDKRAVLTAC